MTIFYLSFAEPRPPKGRGWLGGIYIEADSMMDAVEGAWALGQNPGGEVLAGKLPPGVEVPAKWHNRLLTEDEVRESDAEKRLINRKGKEI